MRYTRPCAAILLFALFGRDAAASGDPAAALDAACVRPSWSGELPEPAAATQEQMLEAQRSVKAFDQAVAAYGECLAAAEARLVAAGGDAERILEARAQRNDGAVGDAERLAVEFNTRLRAWRERPPATDVQPPKSLGVDNPNRIAPCYSDKLRRAGIELRSSVILLIDVDGKASVGEWPAGASEGLKETVLCLLQHLRFEPAMADGRPVPASVIQSFSFSLTDTGEERVKFEPPVAVSTPEELAQAQAECAPQGVSGSGEPALEIEVDYRGKITKTRVVESSGDAAVDALALCIAGKTRFTPGQRNGRPVKAIITTTVRIGM